MEKLTVVVHNVPRNRGPMTVASLRCLRVFGVLTFVMIYVSASQAPDSLGRIPFDVYFDTTSPLGIRLDTSLVVQGFSRTSEGVPGPAEAAKWIIPGDSLISVNGQDVCGAGLQRAVLAIRDATLPKVPVAPACHCTIFMRACFVSLFL